MAWDINYTEVSLSQSWESGMGKSSGVYLTFCMFGNVLTLKAAITTAAEDNFCITSFLIFE